MQWSRHQPPVHCNGCGRARWVNWDRCLQRHLNGWCIGEVVFRLAWGFPESYSDAEISFSSHEQTSAGAIFGMYRGARAIPDGLCLILTGNVLRLACWTCCNLVSCVRPPATCSYSDIVQLLLPVVSNTDSFQLVYYNQSVDCNNARLVFDVYIRRRDQSLTPSSRSGQRRRPAFQPRLSPCETPRPAGVRSET